MLQRGNGTCQRQTTHFVRETMSQQPINPLWSIRDTAGQKSLSTSLRTPRQAIQYKDIFEAGRRPASSIGECVCIVHSTWGTLLIVRTAHPLLLLCTTVWC